MLIREKDQQAGKIRLEAAVPVQKKQIQTPEKNLKSKIDSLLRSLQNLSEKRARIEFEIKKQSKSLLRKREELKRVSTSTRAKLKVSLESSDAIQPEYSQDILAFQREVSQLLEESARVLDQLNLS